KKMSDEHLGATNGLKSFSGRYSGEMIRHAFDRWYDQGSLQGKWWENRAKQELSSGADIALFGVILAALYRQPQQLFEKAWQLCSFWLDDLAFASQNLIYIMTVQGIINGVPLLDLCDYLVDLFTEMDEIGKRVASYDDVGAIAHTLRLVEKPQILDMDDRFMPLLMGMDCHIYHLLPGGYYYACKYCADFEQGMLYAANSGGNNVARTALTGGLLGAMNGLSGIPQRWVDGLQNYPEQIPAGYGSQGEYLLSLAAKIAAKSH
ncbi:MAG: ADP-ribosylglycohydrolase family protein, partial [Clostridiales bacterium]